MTEKKSFSCSERNGWGHYYLYDTATGNLKKQVTDGTWVAGPIAKIDTVRRKIYFYGYGREKEIDPYYYILYEAQLDRSKYASSAYIGECFT